MYTAWKTIIKVLKMKYSKIVFVLSLAGSILGELNSL